jgi:hypothetical protein
MPMIPSRSSKPMSGGVASGERSGFALAATVTISQPPFPEDVTDQQLADLPDASYQAPAEILDASSWGVCARVIATERQ